MGIKGQGTIIQLSNKHSNDLERYFVNLIKTSISLFWFWNFLVISLRTWCFVMKLNVKGKYEAEKDNEMNLKKKVGMYQFLICRAVSVGLWSLKPCPFESGLKKFALEPVVMFFFKKCQKDYKCWLIQS